MKKLDWSSATKILTSNYKQTCTVTYVACPWNKKTRWNSAENCQNWSLHGIHSIQPWRLFETLDTAKRGSISAEVTWNGGTNAGTNGGLVFFFKALTKKNNKTCPIFTDARFFFFTKLDASSVASCNPNDPCFDWKRPSFEGKSKDTQVTQVPGRYDMMHHFFFAPEKTNRAWKRSASCQTWGIFFCSFLRDFC